MTNKLNVYQLLFAALLVLKIGDVDKFSDFSWWIIITPLAIGILHSVLLWFIQATNISKKLEEEIQEMYLDNIRKKATKKAIKEIEKEQETTWKRK